MAAMRIVLMFLCGVMMTVKYEHKAEGALSAPTRKLIDKANKNGPYLGLVIPNAFHLSPLLQSPDFRPNKLIIDFSGKRFRFGMIDEKKVVLVVTGLGVINAGLTTQLLLSIFNIEGVVHYGIGRNANPSFNLGDVVIPQYWAHIGLWNWQKYGHGPENALALEPNGEYSRKFGYTRFSDYAVNVSGCSSHDNLLNYVWYQEEEIFPIDGVPEVRQRIFWVPVDDHYFNISKKLEGLKLERCLNATKCLCETPKVGFVDRGTTASILLDNAAYRSFIYEKLNGSVLHMETAAVALVAYQQKLPFISINILSDLGGGGTPQSDEAEIFVRLYANNSVVAVLEFIKQLP